MDFKSMLQQLSQLSEGTQETEKGRVHKAEPGGYGRKFDTDEEGDEKKDDKDKKAAKKDDAPKKRGRPPKTGEHSKSPEEKEKQEKREKAGQYLQSYVVGNLPGGKAPGKKGTEYGLSANEKQKKKDEKAKEKAKTKKSSLKEWVQEIENKYVAENAPGQQLTVKPMPGAAQLVDPATQKVMATGDAAAIKNVQGAVAQGKVQMRGDVDESMDEGVHTRLNTYRIKGQDLIDQISIQDGAEVEMVDDDVAILVVDTITFPELASMASKLAQQGKIKAIAGHATRDLTGKAVPVGRKYVSAPSPRDPKPMSEGGKKVADAAKAKLKKKVSEVDSPSDQVDMGAGLGAARSNKTFEGKKPDFLDLDKDKNKTEPMSDAAKDAEKKPKKKVSESVHKHNAARLLGKHHALAKEAYNCKYDDMEEARLYHEGYKEGLDECYGQMPVQGLVSENPMPATTPGMASAAMPPAMEDALTEGNTEKRTASQWLADPKLDTQVIELQVDGINITNAGKGLKGFTDGGRGYPYPAEPYTSAKNPMYFKDFLKHVMGKLGDVKVLGVLQAGPGMAVGEGNAFTKFLATHDKGETGTVGGRTVTDTSSYDADVDESFMAFESWDKELNALLNEGMTVSISKGQQGMPDSVSVSAQDAEADQLLGLIKQAGMGLFGGEDKPQGFAADVTGMSAGGEEEGRDSDDIGVVDDHDGMMALIKKVVGGHQEPEEVGAGSDEGHDYEGEDSDEEHDHEGHDHGDREETDEETCNECGMMESNCECDSESVDEDESYGQEEYEVAEDNAPDSGATETTADEDAEAEEDQALATANESNQAPSAPVSQHSLLQRVSGPNGLKSLVPYEKKPPESKDHEKVTEWANNAGEKGTDESFETDINFITRVLAGGLNKEKSTGQTTVPVIAGQNDRMGYSVKNESISDWKKLAGLK